MNIRIVKPPPGETPDDVRVAWVGLTLPVVDGYKGPVIKRTLGVCTAPRGPIARWRLICQRKGERVHGYLVNAATAVNILEQSNPTAASWWRENVPHLLNGRDRLQFHTECCEVV